MTTPETTTTRKSSQSLLLQHAFSQFISMAERKISFILNTKNDDLYQELVKVLDHEFTSNMGLLGSMAKYDLKCIIDSLMAWRKSKNELERDANYESKLLLFNYILVMILKNILSNLSEDALPENLGVKIEEMVFGQLTHTDPDVIVKKINRHSNIESFAMLAGVLSELRFPSVSSRFLAEINKHSAIKESKGELLIRCMRYLKLKIYPLEKLEETVHFLKVCGESFLESHSLKLKHAFAMTFLDLLEPVAAVASAEVNLPTWMKTVELIFPKAQKMIGKPRHFQTAIPLITTLLCVSKRDFFLKNWLGFCNTFVQRFKERDKPIRQLALASVIRLVWVYLFRCTDSVMTNAIKKMDSLLRIMFPFGRRTVIPSDLDLGMYIRLVYYICNKFPDFSAENVFPLLLGYSNNQPAMATVSLLTPDESNQFFAASSPIYPTSLQSSSSSLSLISNTSLSESVPLERFAIGIGAFHCFIVDVLVFLSPLVSSKPTNGSSKLQISTSAVLVESKYTLSMPRFPRFTDTSTFDMCEIQASDLASSLPPIITLPFIQKMNSSTKETLEKLNEAMGFVGSILEAHFRKVPILELITNTPTPSMSSPQSNLPYVSSTITSIASLASNRSSLADQSLSSLSLMDFRAHPNSSDRNFMHELWKIWIDAIPISSPCSMNPRTIISFVTLGAFSGNPSLHDSALLCLERISRIESVHQSDFWTLNDTSWREYVIEIFLESAYRCLSENMTDLLGAQWKMFEMSIMNSIHRLLDLWLDDVKLNSTKNMDKIVNQLEGCSLIFLCSVNSEIRRAAVEILKKISLLYPSDATIEKERAFVDREDKSQFNRYIPTLKRPMKEYSNLVPHKSRILSIFRQIGRDLIKRHYSDPSAAFRVPYASKDDELREKEQRKALFSDPNALMNLAGSSSINDMQIWRRCFLELSKAFYDYAFVQPLVLAFRQLMNVIHILSPTISQSSDLNTKISSGTIKWASDKPDKRIAIISDELLEQWSFYCMFAVSISGIVTVKDLQLLINGPAPSELAVETLFHSLLDFMGAERTFIRHVAIQALCGIHSCNYSIFLDLLEPYMVSCMDIMNAGNIANNRKSTSSNLLASQKRSERQRQDLVHILSYVADFVDHEELRSESCFISKIMLFIKQTARFLSIPEIQNEWDHQLLRFYFCSLVSRFYSHLVRAVYDTGGRKAFEDIISFELRLGLFRLFETWCGYGDLSKQTREREAYLMNQVLEQVRDINERASLTSLMEEQRNSLEVASLKAMCALSFGPLSHATIPANTFDLPNIIKWIKSIFAAPDSKIYPIAHLALDHILSSNSDDDDLWNLVINECYIDPEKYTSIGFFLVLADLICQNKPHPCSLAKICTLTLYKIGHPDLTVRNAAARLFTRLDQHFAGVSSALTSTYDIAHILDDFDSPLPERDESQILMVSNEQNVDELTPDSHLISRPIPAIYKGVQSGISAKWANLRNDLSLSIMMECLIRIDSIDKRWNDIKDMLKLLAPWVSSTNLESLEMKFLHEKGKHFNSLKPPSSPEANLCLTILFCLTVKYAHDFSSEIEVIWLMLFEFQDEYTYRISMEIIAGFLIQVALQKRNPKSIFCGKTVLIYLAQLNAFEILIQRITPENMIPYVADNDVQETSFMTNMKMIDSVLLDTSNEQPFSRTQIAIMFISDMILQIAPATLIPHLPTILHVCIVHIDHFSSNVTDDCMALLNGTIQALVLDLNEPIISQHSRNIIKHEDLSPPNFFELESVKEIKLLVEKLASLFSGLDPQFRNGWAEVSFRWGIACPIRHIACRSLQIYRCLLSDIDKHDTGKLILRISTILGDKIPNVQGYAMECLETLIYMLKSADSMEEYVGIWWAGVACLYSPHIWEYAKGIEILCVFPDRLSFDSQQVLDMLSFSKPTSIDGDPILERLFQGLYMDDLAAKTLQVFNILSPLPISVEFLGDKSLRLLYGILANITEMMKSFDSPTECSLVFEVSALLCDLARSLEYDQLSDLLLSFSKRKFRSKEDFIFQLWSIIYDIYPSDIKSIVSIILKLTSRKDTVEIVLQVLFGLVRVLGPSKFSGLSKSSNFWSPLIDLIQTNASSPGLVAVLDLALSKNNTSETDIRMLFGQSKSSKSLKKSPSVDARQVRRNLQNVSRNVHSHMNSTSARNERLKRELKAVSSALEEELET